MNRLWIALPVILLASQTGFARQSASAQANQPANSASVAMAPRTILAINYQNRTKTEIAFQGSPLMPLAKGQAVVESKGGRISVNAEIKGLEDPSKFGPEYLTYVLWAITPEGKSENLGELLRSGENSKLDATTTLQTFGLIVTAEPYFAVSTPSDVVVVENNVLPQTVGTLNQMNVNYRVFKRGLYSYNVAAASQSYPKSKVPLELEEARNAVQIATSSGAQQYAADTLSKAQQSLNSAEAMAKKGDKKVMVQDSRDAVQSAAEAVQMTMQRKEEQQQAQERAAAAQRTAEAQAQAQLAAAQQQQEAAARQQAELAKQQADMQRQQAEMQAQKDALARAEAEAKAQRDAQAAAQAQQAAAQAQQAANQAIQEQQQLRAALLQQFNRVLPTTDTPRGLKANLADVLFATGKFELKPDAREALAKFSGIVIAHPGLKMQVEGYTDSVGSDTFNQTLSENRSNAVRAYLITQGIDPTAIAAIGYGKANPVASNDTANGRQQNRRVEIIISGEVIGTALQSGQGQPSQ